MQKINIDQLIGAELIDLNYTIILTTLSRKSQSLL